MTVRLIFSPSAFIISFDGNMKFEGFLPNLTDSHGKAGEAYALADCRRRAGSGGSADGFFEKNHFSVDAVNDGFSAYEYGASGGYDAIILDVMMPKMNGIEVLQKLRNEGMKTPIMMLTAKAQKDDRITGFNAGADDYLPKPFEPDELICRVRAMLRRSEEYRPAVLSFGDLTLNPGNVTMECSGKSVRLSGREFQLMELFMRSPQVTVSAERIMERIWGWDSDAEINVVWVHISNLRKKLKAIGSGVSIYANRGLGYVLEDKT